MNHHLGRRRVLRLSSMGSRVLAAFSVWAPLALAGGAAQADELVYREVFPNNVAANNLSVVDWFAHGGNSATQLGGTGTTSTTVHVAHVVGGPQLTPVNSNPASSLTAGYTFHGGTAGQPQLLWTNEYAVPSAEYTGLTTASWYRNHASASSTVSLAVQINGGPWYATDQVGTPTGATFGSSWSEEAIDVSGATWQALNFVPGSSLGLTGPTGLALPAGDITAFGLYRDSFISSMRFDTFSLFAEERPPLSPEPSTLLLCGVTLLCVAGVAWRRRRAAAA